MSLRKLLTGFLCLNFAGAVLADNVPAPPVSGIDPAAMDKAVRPQDDLFRFVRLQTGGQPDAGEGMEEKVEAQARQHPRRRKWRGRLTSGSFSVQGGG